ncbi:hypothetical protein HPB50_011622 [Hyalomma asiaticum]|uniref:Uncharacterized protein n=1 Tax=Hyalomma asiaticum TaxID=266040 RepID=A0ACB7TH10_HYAAI|nr:hypothetical protein HPB50_011622 [Hyalomma asiaticum]
MKLHIALQKHQNYVRAAEGQGNTGSFFQNSHEDCAIHVECLFTGFLVEHNLPLGICDHAGPLFWKMFLKCEDTKRYGCGRTKTTAIIGEMAADAENTMMEALKCHAFAVTVDRSSNSRSQMYPIVVTYYVVESRNVESRLLCLQELHGGATGRKIGNLILDAPKSCGIVVVEKCVAFSADNASVMAVNDLGADDEELSDAWSLIKQKRKSNSERRKSGKWKKRGFGVSMNWCEFELCKLELDICMVGLLRKLAHVEGIKHTVCGDKVAIRCTGGSEGQVVGTMQESVDVTEQYLLPTGLSCSPAKSELLLYSKERRPESWKPVSESDIHLFTRSGGSMPMVGTIKPYPDAAHLLPFSDVASLAVFTMSVAARGTNHTKSAQTGASPASLNTGI